MDQKLDQGAQFKILQDLCIKRSEKYLDYQKQFQQLENNNFKDKLIFNEYIEIFLEYLTDDGINDIQDDINTLNENEYETPE